MFFFSIKSDRSYLASTQWAIWHIKQSLVLYFRSAHMYVSQMKKSLIEELHRIFIMLHITINPFVNPTCNALLGIFCTGRYIYAHIHPQKSLIRSTFKTSNMQEYQEITVFYKFQLSNTNQ